MSSVDKDEIDQQFQRLRIYRTTLAHLLNQQAVFGSANVPPTVLLGIQEARQSINRTKNVLRQLGIQVDDYPDDVDTGASLSPEIITNKKRISPRIETSLSSISAIITIIAVIISFLTVWRGFQSNTSNNKESIITTVRTIDSNSEPISNATVSLAVADNSIRSITDQNGVAVLIVTVESDRNGKIIINANGYNDYSQNINLNSNQTIVANLSRLSPTLTP